MSDGEPVGEGLEATARWTAAARAVETARDDRLFRDRWAESLAGPEGMTWAAARAPDSLLPIILRTRYFDDWLLRVLGAQAIRQVVLLAAGLDTRAFRLALPHDARLFEVDRPAVLRHKAGVLVRAGARPRCAWSPRGPAHGWRCRPRPGLRGSGRWRTRSPRSTSAGGKLL